MRILPALIAASAFSACLYAQKPVLTEDFEAGRIDTAVWEQRAVGEATATVETVEGAHGKFALHVHMPGGTPNAYAFIVATHLPDAVRTHYFGRAYMKITPSVGKTHNPFIFTGEPGYPLSKFTEIGTYNGVWQPSFQENKSLTRAEGRGEQTFHSVTGPPLDKWYLLEWEFNDDPATMTIWVDGEKVMTPQTRGGDPVDALKFTWPNTPEGKTSNLTGGYKEFGFGGRTWGQPNPPMDVYYDDIAISTGRLGPVK